MLTLEEAWPEFNVERRGDSSEESSSSLGTLTVSSKLGWTNCGDLICTTAAEEEAGQAAFWQMVRPLPRSTTKVFLRQCTHGSPSPIGGGVSSLSEVGESSTEEAAG